jgi:hypothetical protein
VLARFEAFAMSFRRGLGHLVLFRLKSLGVIVDPLTSCLQRLIELVACALLMPVGSDNRFAPIVGIEGTGSV